MYRAARWSLSTGAVEALRLRSPRVPLTVRVHATCRGLSTAARPPPAPSDGLAAVRSSALLAASAAAPVPSLRQSWFVMDAESAGHSLPADLRAADALRAVDVGAVEQMRLVIRQFAPAPSPQPPLSLSSTRADPQPVQPLLRVLDPFAGFGSTLLAAALEGAASTGIELDANRCGLISRRLADSRYAALFHARPALRPSVVCGDAAVAVHSDHLPGGPFDLIASNVPYFNATAAAARGPPSSTAAAYADYLSAMSRVFEAIRTSKRLRSSGLMVLAVQNLTILRTDTESGGGVARAELLPQAWDLAARVQAAGWRLHPERVLCYPPSNPPPPHWNARTSPAAQSVEDARLLTNRRHEYLLVASQQQGN
jgi:hypothetical protein